MAAQPDAWQLLCAGIPIDGKTVFTSDHALKLDWIPDWIAIIGSGYIGLEFSDVYTALGSDVTFIEVLVCILSPTHVPSSSLLYMLSTPTAGLSQLLQPAALTCSWLANTSTVSSNDGLWRRRRRCPA